jgi:hypothetical protein
MNSAAGFSTLNYQTLLQRINIRPGLCLATLLAVACVGIAAAIAAGRFRAGKYPQVVIAPGDGVGPLRWYECAGDPLISKDWVGRDLAGRDLVHGHSFALGDIDGDGNLDIFAAEMAKWTTAKTEPDNPVAEALIFYGDGKGNFTKMALVKGHGFHEARLADLDGDGDLDILNKPFNWEVPRVDVWLNHGTGARRVKRATSNPITKRRTL